MTEYARCGEEEPVLWFRQTIRHSCGLMAVLHAACNGAARGFIVAGSTLEGLVREAKPLGPKERAEVVYNSEALKKAHREAAEMGDTAPGDLEERERMGYGFHFVTFVKAGKGLWELNGGMKGPVYRGNLGEGEDAVSERALELGVRTFLVVGGQEGLSLVALAGEEGVSGRGGFSEKRSNGV